MDSANQYGIWGILIMQLFQLLGGAELGKALVEWLKLRAGANTRIQELEKELLILQTEKRLTRSHGKPERIANLGDE